MKALRHFLEYAGVRLVEAALSLLSWENAQKAGAFLGGAATRLNRKRWELTLRNVGLAFPEKPAGERQAIAREAWRNAGRIAAEFARSRHLTPAELREIVKVENLEHCRRILAEGKGVIINIGHLGNWEVGGIGFTEQGLPLGVVGRVQKNPLLDRWVSETRSRFGEEILGHRNPFFSLVKWLKQGKMTAILIDHNLHEGGIFVPFFGRPAATSTLSALLAVKLGCPILSCRVRRDGPRILVWFDEPLRADAKADADKEVERLTVEMTRHIEGYIRQRPGEWLWGHNRWKRQPDS